MNKYNFNSVCRFYILLVISISTLFFSVSVFALCSNKVPSEVPDIRFLDNIDGTINDIKTGLMWKKCTEGHMFNSTKNSCQNFQNAQTTIFSWDLALQRADSLNVGGGFAGHTNWRLPNRNELISLIGNDCSPSTNTKYLAMSLGRHWTSSPATPTPGSNSTLNTAWFVDFDVDVTNGTSARRLRTDEYSVHLVRDVINVTD